MASVCFTLEAVAQMAEMILFPEAACDCDLNQSTQHLNSNYREGGVVYEEQQEKIFHSVR
jgi:hypothetical protein